MKKGFTLIELLIVVAIIGIIAAMAIPNLLKSTMAANESTCIGNMRTYFSAQHTYRSTRTPRSFGNAIPDLADDGQIDPAFAAAVQPASGLVHSGYLYEELLIADSLGRFTMCQLEAGPEAYDVDGKRQFYMSPGGQIWTRDLGLSGLPTTIADPPPTNVDLQGADWNTLAE